jgi:hypothetical protein
VVAAAATTAAAWAAAAASRAESCERFEPRAAEAALGRSPAGDGGSLSVR